MQEGQKNDLLRIITALKEHEVDFVVCGGVACVLHGVNRVTQDIDLFVRLEEENLNRFLHAVQILNVQPRMPEPIDSILNPQKRKMWVQEKGAVVFTLHMANSPVQIDVFLDYPIQYDELLSESVRMNIEGMEVPVSSVRHLLEAKRTIPEPRRSDLRDIEDLTEILEREQS